MNTHKQLYKHIHVFVHTVAHVLLSHQCRKQTHTHNKQTRTIALLPCHLVPKFGHVRKKKKKKKKKKKEKKKKKKEMERERERERVLDYLKQINLGIIFFTVNSIT